MTFDEHVQRNRREDGTYDLAAAEQSRAKEIEASKTAIAGLAAKAAKQERRNWEATETQHLRKQFTQPALSPELEMRVKVPLGNDTAVEYGEMNRERIRIRKDLRTQVHLHEIRAFDAEMTHWAETEKVLDPGETIGAAIERSGLS